jgi:mannobiose 2-epimerase
MGSSDLIRLGEELKRELKENILPWWMQHAPDRELGGFHGHIDHQNQVVKGAGKGSVLHSRILWTFSAAYRMYKDPGYLENAQRAFAYLVSYFTDKKHGGIYWELKPDGNVLSPRKQVYAIAFAIYGLAEYHLACGEDYPLKIARGLFRDMEAHALDRERNGYMEAMSRDWQDLDDLRLSEKDHNEAKTMNTHLHILEAYGKLYQVWKDPQLEKALENLIRLFLDIFLDRERMQLNLFFDENWILKSSLVSYGHDIECSWLLHEAARILNREELVEECGEVAVKMARAVEAGLDKDGGLSYEFFPENMSMDREKHWWPQAEAMVGFFNAWQISNADTFLERAMDSWGFIQDNLIDRELGEWYWSVDSQGIPRTDREKGGFWKCPYHNGRACMELIGRINGIMHNNTK